MVKASELCLDVPSKKIWKSVITVHILNYRWQNIELYSNNLCDPPNVIKQWQKTKANFIFYLKNFNKILNYYRRQFKTDFTGEFIIFIPIVCGWLKGDSHTRTPDM